MPTSLINAFICQSSSNDETLPSFINTIAHLIGFNEDLLDYCCPWAISVQQMSCEQC